MRARLERQAAACRSTSPATSVAATPSRRSWRPPTSRSRPARTRPSGLPRWRRWPAAHPPSCRKRRRWPRCSPRTAARRPTTTRSAIAHAVSVDHQQTGSLPAARRTAARRAVHLAALGGRHARRARRGIGARSGRGATLSDGGAASGPVGHRAVAGRCGSRCCSRSTNGSWTRTPTIVRGGVFANVQTGNVIFFAIDVSERQGRGGPGACVADPGVHRRACRWPSHIKSGRVEQIVPHPLRWTMAVQVVALAIIGFVPVIGRPHLRHGADRVSRRGADRPVPQHRRPGLPAGRHDRQPDAVHRSPPTTGSSSGSAAAVAPAGSTAR